MTSRDFKPRLDRITPQRDVVSHGNQEGGEGEVKLIAADEEWPEYYETSDPMMVLA